MSKTKILITGVSGLLGSNLAFCWKDRHDILGIYNTHAVVLPGVRTQQADLLQLKAFEAVVKLFRPDIIVHCAALADIDRCQTDTQLADAMNVDATANVCQVAKEYNARVVYISTDAVYGNGRGRYSEEDPLDPINYYAQTKLKGEALALRIPESLIVRTSFYGWNIREGKMSLAEWVIDQLSHGNTIKGFTNVISSNIYTQDFAVILEEMMNRRLKGVFNLGCRQGMSKYDFARGLATELNFPANLIMPFDVDKFTFKAPRGKDLSLAVDRLENALGRPMPDAQSCIKHFLKDKGLWNVSDDQVV